MRIDILTLFPESFEFLKDYGVLGKAVARDEIQLNTIQIRDFATDKHHRVDDTLFGGEPGMLMMPEPIVSALESVPEGGHVIYLSPQGQVLNQDKCKELAKRDHLVLLCGHYEGVDARVIHHYIDEEISVGDYVLTGGEIPAMILIDAVSRMLDGVLGNADSAKTDSHYNILLQHDGYTRPRNFRGYEVPEVLFSGNHAKIEEWRRENSLLNTKNKRPDLYEKYMEALDTKQTKQN